MRLNFAYAKRPAAHHFRAAHERAGRVRARVTATHFVLLSLALLLSACGGGGGGSTSNSGSQSSGSGQTSSSTTPSLAANSSLSLNVSADTSSSSGSGPEPQGEVTLSAPPTQWYYELQWTGTAATGASMAWTTQPDGSALGTLTAYTYGAAQMGAGTYFSTVNVSVCYDSQCATQVPGSPIAFTVQYLVTGNPIPDTTFAINPSMVSVESSSDNSVSPTADVTLTGQGLPTYGAYPFVNAPTNIVSSTNVTASTTTPGQAIVALNFVPGSQLSPGLYTGTAQISICFDSRCTKPANGSPFPIPVSYDVTAVAGKDFNQQSIPIASPLADIALDLASQQIVELSEGTYPFANFNISILNPATGTVTRSATISVAGGYLSDGPLAVSDDGQFAYVGIWGATLGVQRVNLTTMTADVFIPTNSGTIQTIKVAPGEPHTIAVEADQVLTIYDDAVARTQTYPMGISGAPYAFCWGQDASTIFAYASDTQSLLQLNAGTGGLTLFSTTPGVNMMIYGGSSLSDLQYSNGIVYSDEGKTFDTSTNSVGNAFALQYPVSHFTLDSQEGKAFFLQDDYLPSNGDNSALRTFDLSSGSFLWMSRFTSRQVSRLLRWGSNGLAYIASDPTSGQQSLQLLSGSLLGP